MASICQQILGKQFDFLDTDVRRFHCMQVKAIRIFCLPWPKLCFPEIWTVERGDDDRFHFDIGAQFRHFGLLVAYSGYLNLPDAISTP